MDIIYRASDGTEFNDEDECLLFEKNLEEIKSGKSASYFELCTLFKNEESNNNAIIGITKLIPIVSKIEVVINKKRNRYIE